MMWFVMLNHVLFSRASQFSPIYRSVCSTPRKSSTIRDINNFWTRSSRFMLKYIFHDKVVNLKSRHDSLQSTPISFVLAIISFPCSLTSWQWCWIKVRPSRHTFFFITLVWNSPRTVLWSGCAIGRSWNHSSSLCSSTMSDMFFYIASLFKIF